MGTGIFIPKAAVAEFGLLFVWGFFSTKMSGASSEASGSRSSSPEHEEEVQGEQSGPLFSTLPLVPELQKTVLEVGYRNATEIQAQAIPAALEGRDIIGVAKTGSGKTAAFALPILQKWWEDPKPLYACVIAPTRYVAILL